jgi:hypothetical protein
MSMKQFRAFLKENQHAVFLYADRVQEADAHEQGALWHVVGPSKHGRRRIARIVS